MKRNTYTQNILDKYLNPYNARIDINSSKFGRSADYDAIESSKKDDDASKQPLQLSSERIEEIKKATNGDVTDFDYLLPPSIEYAGQPQQEPIFGTYYWCQEVTEEQLQEWDALAQPQLPVMVDTDTATANETTTATTLSLPQKNPFIPTKFDQKPLPPSDCDHPLLNFSIKLQIAVGKRKVRL